MKNKTVIIAFIFFTFISRVCAAQESSNLLNSNSEKINEAPDFKESRDKLIEFHMSKVVDHQKVVDCLKVSKNIQSMNTCNKHVEKYFKKVEETKPK